MITRENALYIAGLARLKLSETEIDNFTGQLGSILEYIEQLNNVDTSDIEPTNFMAPSHDPLRDDIEKPSLEPEKVLQNGPNVKKGYFAIPKVIGG